ncbi:hypothetical protein LOZ61_001337 [Ophidiomyces ophidiicola]|uniref:Uncharacterized protein n=1 Tax=Ophidiomyces ophidiicola TaxID=1387563 RepID=A0ACB8V646_9EURO|nr:hypothetical protein LOZ61_001337 [Ophidiomyces ophidiicola]KAI1930574.1 hypothetical protein LOZ60_000805 [Ophidiomyces ophidiicola]KAI2131942.1 hypothetical protein LOZ31_000309 [Ophidiomyces ophidiicola]KAI2148105.1 hypothetical protein LOZ27_002135 [Ophidiomyces ophidiicola]KAI2198869.1 hypothetical protein LOZ20_002189 [Ophidiomyces ophidiicola]
MSSCHTPESLTKHERRGRLTAIPSAWEIGTSFSPGFGISNDDQLVCFRNSVFVALLHMPVMYYWLCEHNHSLDDPARHKCVTCILSVFGMTYWTDAKLKNHQRGLNRLMSHYVWSTCKITFWKEREGVQQDAEEFLQYLLSHLSNDPLGPERSHQELLQHMFYTVIKYREECTMCKHVSFPEKYSDSVLRVHIPDSGSPTLPQALVQTMGVPDASYKCGSCFSNAKPTRRGYIRDAPEILVIALNRHGNHTGTRRTNKVTYEEHMDLTELLEPYAREKGESLTYKLYSVIFHIGTSSERGHYITVARSPTDQWSYIDDEEIHSANVQDALGNDSRHSKLAIPYLLFYARTPFNSTAPRRIPIDPNFFKPKPLEPKPLANDSSYNEKLPTVPEVSIEKSTGQASKPDDENKRTMTTQTLNKIESNAEVEASISFPAAGESNHPEVGDSPTEEAAVSPSLSARWEGQPAEVIIKVIMGDIVLEGKMKGVLRRSRGRPDQPTNTKGSVPPEKPEGVKKNRKPPGRKCKATAKVDTIK